MPKIELEEIELLNKELFEQYIVLAFDGTTRLGEAVNITRGWCSAQFYLRLRLLHCTTLAKYRCPIPVPHMTALHIPALSCMPPAWGGT